VKYLPAQLRNLLLLLLAFGPLWLAKAQETIYPEAIKIDFMQLQTLLLQPEIADKVATYDSLGRRGIYLIPDKNLEWTAFQRPNPDSLSLYTFYPEEIWWYRVRHWLEITELREKNQEIHLRMQSRHVGDAVQMDYLIYFKFRRSLSGWELAEQQVYDLD